MHFTCLTYIHKHTNICIHFSMFIGFIIFICDLSSFCACFFSSDGQFPIEISSVTRDHDFLDQDAIEALCR